MQENEKDQQLEVNASSVMEAPAEPVETVEEREAEEFAAEMHAEPTNVDGDAPEPPVEEAVDSEATELADAAVEESVSEPPAAEAAAEFSGEPAESAAEAPEQQRETLSADELFAPDADKDQEQAKWPAEDVELLAMLEAIIYIADEPLTMEQISAALEQPRERIKRLLDQLVAEWQKPHHGLSIREVAGGYKMATKPEHHEAVRQFVKNLKAPMKLSLPALETLAVIAYKQPVTAPEIMEIRGVQGAGVLKTLIDRKLIAGAGRKNVIGKPILYKTTREFLVQFGLKDLSELPSVKEFEEITRLSTPEPQAAEESPAPAARPATTVTPPEAAVEAEPVGEAQEIESKAGDASTEGEPETEAQAEAAVEAEPVAEVEEIASKARDTSTEREPETEAQAEAAAEAESVPEAEEIESKAEDASTEREPEPPAEEQAEPEPVAETPETATASSGTPHPEPVEEPVTE